MTKPKNQLMVHINRTTQQYLPYLDKIAIERDVSRARLVNEVMTYVLENNMLEQVYEELDNAAMGEGRSYYLPRKNPEHPLVPAPPKAVNLFVTDIVDDTPTVPRADLPEPSRRTRCENISLRPRYVSTRSNIAHNFGGPEKSKRQLRDELRQAVENTR